MVRETTCALRAGDIELVQESDPRLRGSRLGTAVPIEYSDFVLLDLPSPGRVRSRYQRLQLRSPQALRRRKRP